MPSDTRYSRAASARRSPNARLYSAVPRSSQCPSMVMIQAPYFLSTSALELRTDWPSDVTSELSYAKNTGRNGESRFRSSSDFDPIASSATGSAGTTVGSATGSGGAGGRGAAEPVEAGGG